eukprot:COSAG01_NODE_9507_length_2408_cov_1.270189_5_plen_104_part_00
MKGKVTHEEKELPDWFKGTKYSDEERGNTASKNFPATPHFVELIPDGEAQRLKDRLKKAVGRPACPLRWFLYPLGGRHGPCNEPTGCGLTQRCLRGICRLRQR